MVYIFTEVSPSDVHLANQWSVTKSRAECDALVPKTFHEIILLFLFVDNVQINYKTLCNGSLFVMLYSCRIFKKEYVI